MNLKVIHLDGTEIILSDYNISVTDFRIDSPSPRFNWNEIEGRDGLIDLGTTYGERKISAEFEFVSEDHHDFPLLRNQVFKIFDSRKPFYIIDDREPDRRWLVKANGFSPSQLIVTLGRFSIDFISPSAYAETVKTTLEMPIAEISGGKTVSYKHTTNTFDIYNGGDAEVDPRIYPLVIKFTGLSTDLSINNLTTGEEWVYNDATNASDIILLDGIRSTKNGLSIFGTTNKKLISLAKGWNSFEVITNSPEPFEISFEFRYYTL